jgi:aldose 1-epimerase
MALSGEQYTIAAGGHRAVVTEVGATLRRYTHDDRDVVEPFEEDEVSPHSAGAVLVPWPNRIRGGHYAFGGIAQQLPLTEPANRNAIHGLARWVRWTPEHLGEASLTLATDLVPQTGWPFEVRVQVRYSLDAEGLTVTTEARNHGVGLAPFGAGFHPYLALHGHPLDAVTLLLPAARRLVADEVQIPVGERDVAGTAYDLRDGRPLGERRFDDAFTALAFEGGRGAAEVRTPDGGARVWFDEQFGYLQAFTLATFAHRSQAVAIEPMTCPADAFNSGDGLISLEPGGTWTGSWGITPL